jgi:hypothetical protein
VRARTVEHPPEELRLLRAVFAVMPALPAPALCA